MSTVGPHPNDASILQLPDRSEIQLNWRAAALPGWRLVRERDNTVVPGIDQALELKRPILNLRGPGAEPLDVPLAPALGMKAFDCELELVSDDFHPERGAGIATLHARRPLLIHPSHDLDVLLRHRPRSISLAEAQRFRGRSGTVSGGAGSKNVAAGVPRRPRPTTQGAAASSYDTAFALIASNSAWVIVPASRSSFAFAISAADPPAASRTY